MYFYKNTLFKYLGFKEFCVILFATSTAYHLLHTITGMQHGLYTKTIFSDGEFLIEINQDVHCKSVWVIASMQSPADNLLELYFLLDALDKAGACINLFITYFSYARQLSLSTSQAGHVSAVSGMLRQFNLNSLHIMHPHTNLLQNLLPHTVHIDMRFLQQHAAMYDALVAPDKGAEDLVAVLAAQSQKEVIRLSKVRLNHGHISITAVSGDVVGKRLLIIDDIIATGSTIMLAAEELKRRGALHVAVVATHGIFVPGSYTNIEKSAIDSVVVTNSLAQSYRSSKIQVYDIGAYIKRVMQS